MNQLEQGPMYDELVYLIAMNILDGTRYSMPAYKVDAKMMAYKTETTGI